MVALRCVKTTSQNIPLLQHYGGDVMVSQDTLPSLFPIASLSKYYYDTER